MVVKFRNTIWPPPPQLSLHRRAALASKSNGTRSAYSREKPKSSLYCEMSMRLSRRDTPLFFTSARLLNDNVMHIIIEVSVLNYVGGYAPL
jgi:hypothetical protein